jgi:N-glycosylase/DNA lyase
VFEDAVKMICTTNCTWALTRRMVADLVRTFGVPMGDGRHAFPTPSAIAGATEADLRRRCTTGYRSPYILELSRRVTSGELDPEAWRDPNIPEEELYWRMRSVKGIGEYAAGNLLKLAGRYERLGLDSWVRQQFSRLHHRGRRVSDRTIERHYREFGAWRGLFFWLEMTRDWHEEKFPT